MTIYSDDSAKTNPWQEDKLHYAPFSKTLSEMIIDESSPEGFVIGVCGSWGSGKTTALNFTKAYIEKFNAELKDPTDQILVVDFEPWLFSGRSDLISAFFQVLYESIPDRPKGINKLATKLKSYLGESTDSLAHLIAAVGTTVDPTAGILSTTAVTFGKKSLEATISRWNKTPSLQTTYKELSNFLQTKKRRILVVIDDLDRLSDDEINTVMQMVKSMGRLPYVTYLLSYDSNHMRTALKKGTSINSASPDFMEKIVQHEISLPHPTPNILLSLLNSELQFIFTSIEDNDRWYRILELGLRQWIKSPRAINRYANALRFKWPVLRDEIDPADLLAMEGIRLFEPEMFEWIKRNRDFFCDRGKWWSSRGNDIGKLSQEFKSRFVDNSHDKSAAEMVQVLFPQKAHQLMGTTSKHLDREHQLAVRKSISIESHFDTYMQFGLSEFSLPNSAITGITTNLNDIARLRDCFSKWFPATSSDGAGLIIDLLREIDYRLQEPNNITPTTELLSALFFIGNRVGEFGSSVSFLENDLSRHLYYLTIRILNHFSENEKLEALIQTLDFEQNISYAVEVLVRLEHPHGNVGKLDTSSQSPLSREDWDDFAEALKVPFKESLERAEYLNTSNNWAFVYMYTHYFGKDKTKAWIISSAQISVSFLLGIVRSSISTSVETTGRKSKTTYTLKNNYTADLYDVPEIISLTQAAQTQNEFKGKDREKVEVFLRDVPIWMDKNS